eukprot:Pgem_evm1s12496
MEPSHQKLINWIIEHAENETDKNTEITTYEDTQLYLKDGKVLCKLYNNFEKENGKDKIQYNSQESNSTAAQCMANIKLFTDALIKIEAPSQ